MNRRWIGGRRTRRRSGLAAVFAVVLLLAAGCASTDTEPGPAVSPANPAGPCTVPTGTTDDFPNSAGPRLVKAQVPDGADSSTPLVVALHPALGTGEAMEVLTGMTPLAERDEVIIVYPSKVDGPGVWDSSTGSPDVAFIGDLVAYMHDHGCGSPTNTSVLGYSAGAMLTSQVACERPEGISAVMMVAGVLPPEPPCDVPADLAVWALHGTGDPVVRFDGEVVPYVAEVTRRDGYELTRAEMMRQWSLAKGCAAPPESITNRQLVITRYECPNIAPTTLLTFVGGNHDWRMLGNWDTGNFLWSQLADD